MIFITQNKQFYAINNIISIEIKNSIEFSIENVFFYRNFFVESQILSFFGNTSFLFCQKQFPLKIGKLYRVFQKENVCANIFGGLKIFLFFKISIKNQGKTRRKYIKILQFFLKKLKTSTQCFFVEAIRTNSNNEEFYRIKRNVLQCSKVFFTGKQKKIHNKKFS